MLSCAFIYTIYSMYPGEEQNNEEHNEPNTNQQKLQIFGARIVTLAGRILRTIISWIIIPVIIVLILHNFVFQAFHVVGSSMIPTLHDSDYLIISKIDWSKSHLFSLFGKHDYIPARGTIIVFHYPNDPSLVFVKRVVGLPGEKIVISNGKITIYNNANPNGFNPDKNLGLDSTIPTLGDISETIPSGKIFVLGDNRLPGGSFDSRDWGLLPSSDIIGSAVLRLLPIDSVTILNTKN